MSESKHQIEVFKWAKLNEVNYPELKGLHHSPNGGFRARKTAVRLKKEGTKAGYPDIVLNVARGKFHGLFIEMKFGKNKPTPQQKAWLKFLENQGHYIAVCYDCHEAIKLIEAYLLLK